MEFQPETLANAHARMAQIKAHAHGSVSTNYFRQEMVGPQILVTATDQTILLANDEYDFFRLYFFTSDVVDLGQVLHHARYPGEVVAGYLEELSGKLKPGGKGFIHHSNFGEYADSPREPLAALYPAEASGG